ncbi:hypothetical protein SDC9_191570 [bioreactor metagenome]|uniref:Uncharacterized protein n=1 Tax=bioreactor metagenome TaxID=1076179 RepID=A0A645I0N7_9ZZZZ
MTDAHRQQGRILRNLHHGVDNAAHRCAVLLDAAQQKHSISQVEKGLFVHCPIILLCVRKFPRLKIFLHTLGGQGRVGADGEGKFQAVLIREGAEPIEKILHLGIGCLGRHHFTQTFQEDVGDIIISGVQAANEALKEGEAAHVIIAGVHETDFGMDVIG